MKKFLLSITVLTYTASFAQVPEDVLRYSFFTQRGSARILATGGAMGSLGGDISALYANPAGLGFYKTSEFVITPGFVLNSNKFNFRGTESGANKQAFNLGTTGFVFGFNSNRSKWTNQAISIGINETANFNNTLSYRGLNNISSYSEVFAEEISNARDGAGNNLSFDAITADPRFAFGTSPAIFGYLVDTFRTTNGGLVVRGLPEFLLDKGIALNQEKTITTKGGIHELAVGYAANMDDKLYLGASLGIPIVNYSRHTFYKESDPSRDQNNYFNYFTLTDNLTTKGAGINAKLGLIFKPSNLVRIGLSVHSPTFYTLTDRQKSSLTIDVENYRTVPSVDTYGSKDFIPGGGEGVTRYSATTPWKTVISGSYVFREAADTRQQRGFITADIEYIGYPSAGFKDDSDYGSAESTQYYNDLKNTIDNYYKGAFNFRLGGELKYNTWMFRAGTGYYGNPYDNSTGFKAHRFVTSGGIGYRNYGMFIDLTYAHTFNRDVNFPYRLSDKDNSYAKQTGGAGNLMLTLGFKL